MMGNRGAANAAEYDAFSRRMRRHIRWKQGELRGIKRGFQKRVRSQSRRALREETRDAS